MNIDDLTEEFLLSLAASDMGSEDLKLMLKINKNHYLSTKSMTQEELDRARVLAIRGWISLVPEDHRASYSQVERDSGGNVIKWGPRTHEHNPVKPIPERYVMLSAGNYAIGTFDFDNLDKDITEYYMKKKERIMNNIRRKANTETIAFISAPDKSWGKGAVTYKALINGKEVGHSVVRPNPNKDLGGWALSNIEIDPAHQGSGIGRKLLQHVINQYPNLYLRVNPQTKHISKEDLSKFYASEGFKHIDENIMHRAPEKMAADKPKFLSLVPPLSKEQSEPLNQDQIKNLDKVEIKDKPKLTVVKNRGETEEERQLRMRKVEDRKAKLFSSNLYQGLLMGDEDFFPTSPMMMIDYFSKGSRANNQYYFEIGKQVADDLPKTRYQDVKQYFSKLLKSFPIFDDDYIGTVYPPINGIEVSLREKPDKILVTIQAEDNSREY